MSPTVPIPGPDGLHRVPADELSEAERSMLGSYLNSVRKVLSNQDPHAAEEFAGVSLAGFELPTDPDQIEDLAFGGELGIDEFYSPDPGRLP